MKMMINKFNDWLFENSNEAIKDFEVFVENFQGETAREEWNNNPIDDDLEGLYNTIEEKLKDSLDNIYSFDPDMEPLFISTGLVSGDNSLSSQEMVKKYSIFAGLFSPDGDYDGDVVWGSTADAWLVYADSFISHIVGEIKLPYCVYMEDRGITRVYISKRDFIKTFGSIKEFLIRKRGVISGRKYGI